MCKYGTMKESQLIKSVVSLFVHNHSHLVRSSFGMMREIINIILPTMSILKMFGPTVILRKSQSMAAL